MLTTFLSVDLEVAIELISQLEVKTAKAVLSFINGVQIIKRLCLNSEPPIESGNRPCCRLASLSLKLAS